MEASEQLNLPASIVDRSALATWLERALARGWTLYAKRLSANDTGATHAHQAGPYLPGSLIKRILPGLFTERTKNPREDFEATFDSPSARTATVNVIWYNNAVVEPSGTRNESRVTGWGRGCPLLDPDRTGSVCLIAFERGLRKPVGCRVWICTTPEEEAAVEERLGSIEPAISLMWHDGASDLAATSRSCDVSPAKLPPAWLKAFPEARALVDFAVAATKPSSKDADSRLLDRRSCEYEVFRILEEHSVLPRIRAGFESIEAFVDLAATVANRRKSRSGRSLELHLASIFREENVLFSHQGVTEGAKKPDFIFPSIERYHDRQFSSDRLRMLAAKTTCKDRWRQILNEADRLRDGRKHLLTLQEGVSVAQFEEMRSEGVQLVVPQRLWASYPKEIRGELVSLTTFVREVRAL